MTKTIAHRTRISSHGNGSPSSSLSGLISQAKSTISDVSSAAADNVQVIRDRISSGVTATQARAKAIAKAARRKASQADDAIRAKPYHAMAIAGGVGLVAGLLIARRRSAR